MAWTEEDRGIALVWQLEERTVCSGCGNSREQSFDIETDGKWTAERHTCHACAARERLAESDSENDPPVYGAHYLTRMSGR